MNFVKYFFSLALFAVILSGCKKEVYDDTTFLASDKAPEKISALFEITQDNSGMVTITPNGEGVGSYDVFYGDGTAAPAKVSPGKNTTHRYAEGVYTVKVVAYSITGMVTEATKSLTVSFRAPENLDFTMALDPANNYRISLTAEALYETNFKVWFGDVANELPMTFNEGDVVNHTYAAVGTYSVKVIAYSGGAATSELVKTITIVDPILLPLTFESATIDYAFANFDGGNATVIDNPHSGGLNTSSKVGRMIKSAGQPWGGSVITLSEPMDFSANKIFVMKVYSPRAGAKVLLKVENISAGGINFEKEVTTTVANAWEELVFDYSAINTANAYHKIVLIFELGTMGDGSPNFTFLFDDITLTDELPVTLPITFERPGVGYAFTGFDGGNTTVINNPQSSGINTSAKVGKMVKGAGQPWGGSFIVLADPINFSVLKKFKMKVYSPRVGAKVLLKVENLTNGDINFQKEMLTTVANQWEELTFDYTAINTAHSYQKIVLIFELDTMGDGSPNFTFLFDDIILTN